MKQIYKTTFFNLAFSIVITFSISTIILAAQENADLNDIIVKGKIRQYRLFVPTSYQKNKPTPLVLNFHGTGGTPAEQVDISDVETLAEVEGFISVSPRALYQRAIDGPNTWNVDKDAQGVDDVYFVKKMIAQLENKYNIDKARIYAMGFSGGARMSSRLGCDLSEQIASIGPVAGIRFPEDCTPSRAVPVITFHGKKDTVNHYTVNKNSPPYWRMGVETAVRGWLNNNHCNQEANRREVDVQVTRLSYAGCLDNSDVVFYQSAIAGHTWPGSKIADKLASYGLGETDKNIPATKLILAFFDAHPLLQND